MNVLHVVCAVSRDHTDPAAILAQRWILTDEIDALTSAGVRSVVLQVAGRDAELVRNGVEYRFVADRWPARLAIRLPHQLRWVPAFAGLARSIRPDVVHLHGLTDSRQMIALKRALPEVPLLAQDQASQPAQGVRAAVQRHAFRHVDAFVFASREQVEPFVAAGVMRPDVRVFEAIAGSCRFTPGDRDAARAATGLRGDPCLLWVGHLNGNKDPLTVLDAVARASSDLPDVQLWCCFQTDPLRAEMERRVAADARLRGRVHLLGRRPRAELEAFYRAADVFVLGTHREGCPWVVIEALACGTPVVATSIPAIRAITDEGPAACLFPPGDAAAAAQCLLAMRNGDAGERRRAARQQFEQKLSFPAIGRQLRAAYEALVANRP